MFSPAQVEQLLRPVNPRRVQQGQHGGRVSSNLAAYDVSAHLTRIFGFGGWRKEILSLELVAEDGVVDQRRDRIGWYVTYRCSMRLHVGEWWNDDGATGSASNLPDRGDAHDFALKNAISYALKRCAKDLGDQFGLSLYNKGSLSPLVIRTLTGDPQPASAHAAVDEGIEELAPDWDEQPPGRDDGLPVNRDGSLSRSRTSDEEKAAAGVMTGGQLAEHTALRRGAEGAVPAGERAGERSAGTPPDDPWYDAGGGAERREMEDAPGSISRQQQAAMHALFGKLGVADRVERLEDSRRLLGLVALGSSSELSFRQAGELLGLLNERVKETAK